MPERVVRLFPEAEAELKTSERWYALRSPTAAAAFLAEFNDALARIVEAPDTCLATAAAHATRQAYGMVSLVDRVNSIELPSC